jgi:AcrR family transcriptional regulator
MPKVVKRSYDASRRRALADSMRQQVIEAAKPLFISQGYEATSMRQLADAAGVSLQTLYNAFGSKFGLFSALMDVIVAGDHEPVALSDRPETQALRAIENPERLVRAIVAAAVPKSPRPTSASPSMPGTRTTARSAGSWPGSGPSRRTSTRNERPTSSGRC